MERVPLSVQFVGLAMGTKENSRLKKDQLAIGECEGMEASNCPTQGSKASAVERQTCWDTQLGNKADNKNEDKDRDKDKDINEGGREKLVVSSW